ncbi:unnamed protein product, partial [Allacma fusca]
AKDDMESMCDQLATEAAGIVDSPVRNTRSQHSCLKQLNARQSKQLITASKINKLLGKRDRRENVIQDQTSQLENDIFQGNTEDTSERDASSSTEVSPVQHNDSEANSCSDKRIAELEAKIEALKESKLKYRARVKELRQQVNDLEDKLNYASSSKVSF